jgi:hypothetical protein
MVHIAEHSSNLVSCCNTKNVLAEGMSCLLSKDTSNVHIRSDLTVTRPNRDLQQTTVSGCPPTNNSPVPSILVVEDTPADETSTTITDVSPSVIHLPYPFIGDVAGH